MNDALLVLHFIGLALGLSASFANMAMGRLIATAPPNEKAVLGRFPPVMGRLGGAGLLLLWATGLTLLFRKWGGFALLAGWFHAKLTMVVLLTLVVGFIHMQEARARRGDATAMARIVPAARLGFLLAILAVVFAVMTFH